MSTTNTDHQWNWYIRKKGRNWYLGIVDEDGSPPDTSDYAIDMWYDQIPDEVTSPQDELPIPRVCEHGFIMGCVYELLRSFGIENYGYRGDFEKAINEAIGRQVKESQQPMVIKPLNLREDK